MYYLDLMTQANLLDHSVWASPDTWTAALEHQAKRKKSGGKGGLIFGAICCIGLVVLILGIVYLVTQRKKK
ncbi:MULTISPECIES: hypothetical protein [Nocardia]|uniref:Uncharacterized protein n=1 Tax=Nocardia otitidiscaviarum TaxID=1823 RepID=A0A516NUC3_9NOCA|nr:MULTISPECIES: hypothetical protein [Nocardia]MBF6178803.1 hypothetical protein [Nocardia otitidiscaviarum]MCP9621913.1 hypothetical protein [Nocardia otitidiscaviarum]QDP82525.1 hypothetical protein FOH10_31160 [Nocardia otitidiscaviarum]